MREVTEGPFEQPRVNTTERVHRRRRRPPGSQTSVGTNDTAGASAETAFWARLEERDEGRLAIEADHLFDTSYAWAA